MSLYEIGIKIGIENAVSPVLWKLSSEFLGLNKSVESLTERFSKLSLASKAAIGGTAAVLAGAGILATYGKIVEKGNELVAVQRRMAQAGVHQKEIAEATAKAYEMSAKYQNTSVTENMRLINDARATFGDQKTATHHIDEFIRAQSFLKQYEGGAHAGGKSLETELIAAMKSGEIAGKIDPESMKEHVAQLVAMKVAYGDQVKIGAYLTAQRNAGVALRNTSDDFRYGMFPALVQENGPNAGTMLMTAFNKVVAGTGNRTKSLERMFELGLLKEDQLDWDKQGIHIKGLKSPDGIKNSMGAAAHFGDWVMGTLKPLLEKKVDEKGLTDPKQRAIYESQLISGMFPDRNAAKAITEILQQFTKLQKDAELQRQAREAYLQQKGMEGNWDFQKQRFVAQTENVGTTAGAPMVAGASGMLGRFNDGIAWMLEKIKGINPSILEAIGKTFMIIGTGLVAAGITALTVAFAAFVGLPGLIVGGIVALGSAIFAFWNQIKSASVAIAAWSVAKWNSFVSGIRDLGAQIAAWGAQKWSNFVSSLPTASDVVHWMQGVQNGVRDAILRIADTFRDWISRLPGMISDAISAAISSIGAKLSAAISSLGAKLNPGNWFGGGGEKRATGGPVRGLHPYIVGENGPELFIPLGSGHVMPSHMFKRPQVAFSGPPPSGRETVIHNTLTLDGEVVHRSVERRMVADAIHPVSAPYHDGMSSWATPDMPFSTG